MPPHRQAEDRKIDLSKYPTYWPYKAGRVIKVPQHEKTSKSLNSIIPISRFGADPNDYNDEDDDMQRYGLLAAPGVENELEREIASMLPDSQMTNLLPTHINDIVPKELRAVPTPFGLAFGHKNTFESTNPLLSTKRSSGLFSALAKQKLLEAAAKRNKKKPDFKGPSSGAAPPGPPGDGDNGVIASTTNETGGVNPHVQQQSPEYPAYPTYPEPPPPPQQDDSLSNFPGYNSTRPAPDFTDSFPYYGSFQENYGAPSSLRDLENLNGRPPPTGADLIINPSRNTHRIVTYDEGERSTIDNPEGPELNFGPSISAIFGELPETALEEAAARRKIADRTNFFVEESLRSKYDEAVSSEPNLGATIGPPKLENYDAESKIDVLRALNIKSDDTGKSEFASLGIADPSANEGLVSAIANQPWDFRQNDEMVENTEKSLNADDSQSVSQLAKNIIWASRGDSSWVYFAEWISSVEGLAALSDNLININGATGELFLNGENIISENLYQFIEATVDENRQEIPHIWEFNGNLSGFVNYRNTKVTPTNVHDTDYMPHIKFLISRFNYEYSNSPILFRHTRTANISESIKAASNLYPDTFVAKLFDLYNSGTQQDIDSLNMHSAMSSLNELNRVYTGVFASFINVISRLLQIQPTILEHSYFRPLKQILGSKYSNALAGSATGEQLVKYFLENKQEFALSFLHCWYNAGKIPPHREAIVSLIPDIKHQELEPSKLFENYIGTPVGGITAIPGILNTIMSFLIEENLNEGWGGLLAMGLNSWYNNLSYGALSQRDGLDLELDSIQQIIAGFSEFIDEYVESFTRKEFDALNALKHDEDWIETISVDSDDDIKLEESAIELKPDISDYNFHTDTNGLFKKEEGSGTPMVITSSNSTSKSIDSRWNDNKSGNDWGDVRKHKIKEHLAESKRLRDDKRNMNRNIFISDLDYASDEDNKDDIMDDLISDYSDSKGIEVQKKIKEFNDRQMVSKALKFDDSLDIEIDEIKREDLPGVIPNEIDLPDDEDEEEEEEEGAAGLERQRDALMRRLRESLINLPQEERDLFPLVSVDFNDNEITDNPPDDNPSKNKSGDELSDNVRLRLANFENTALTREDYELIKVLQQNKSLTSGDISRIISDGHETSAREQLKYDEFIIKSGVGHPLYKEALTRQNTRLAQKVLDKNIDDINGDNMSYDDYMPYKKEEEDFEDGDEDEGIFDVMYSQAKSKGIRLRDHPGFVDAAIALLEESSDMERLNGGVEDSRRVDSQKEIMRQIYGARRDRQSVDFDMQHILYNRSLEDLNALFLNGELSDIDELEYLKLRQEALDLQMREATDWK